ncbi:MAG TPA: type ISP restriction/modification enzyme, partial [Terriglobia bacterium]|nr:type ISP restriction/modification enzyme [Terriglobia bacterium]
ANAAAEIKRDRPILVVLGNPPYSGHSANRSRDEEGKLTFIGQLIEDYKIVDGRPLGERNPKWLQDDYVKFIRFAQWRIERTGYGILGFITNHGYLDNPTFRGMRQQLMRCFSDIYVYNLHGNSKKKERAPDGGKDENVFDIQQGVAIILAVKEVAPGFSPARADLKVGATRATVHHCDLWGLREAKYRTLAERDVEHTPWMMLAPSSPMYLFVPQDESLLEEYERGWKVTDALPLYNMGITTGVDSFAVAFSACDLRDRIADLAGNRDDASLRSHYSLRDTSSFSLNEARAWAKLPDAPSAVTQVAYRCFDGRWIIYSPSVLARAREDVSAHLMSRRNLALATFRAIRKPPWVHVFAADCLITKEYLSALDNCYALPLYLYPKAEKRSGQTKLTIESGHWPPGPGGRRPNLNPAFVAELEKRLGMTFVPDGAALGRGGSRTAPTELGPEDVFHYMYAVFHSPTYRTRYAEFLKSDFPRLPLTSNRELFAALAEKGHELTALHLMESPRLADLMTTFPEKGSNVVEKVSFVAPGFSPAPADPSPGSGQALKVGATAAGRVWINPVQYFAGVPREVWDFHVGGYQVCEKWLKDRKGRALSYDDIQHYQRIVVALKETIRLMAEIDQVIEEHGGWPIK